MSKRPSVIGAVTAKVMAKATALTPRRSRIARAKRSGRNLDSRKGLKGFRMGSPESEFYG